MCGSAKTVNSFTEDFTFLIDFCPASVAGSRYFCPASVAGSRYFCPASVAGSRYC